MVRRNIKKYTIAIILIAIVYLSYSKLNTGFNESIINIESKLNNPVYVGEYLNKYYIGEYNDKEYLIYEYGPNNNKLRTIYKNSQDFFSILGNTCKAGIMVMEIYSANDELSFKIKFSKDGNDFQEVYSDNCSRIPSLYLTDSNLFINYVTYSGENFNSLLIQYDIKKNIIKEIDKKKYNVNKDGKYSGETIIYSGGNKNILYYQLIHLDNQMIETAERTTLIKYSLHKGKIINDYPLDNKTLHISGTSKFVILSEYDFYKPLYKSGKIYNIKEKGLVLVDTLKNVESGRDIMKSKIIGEDLILFTTADSCNIYIFSEKKHLFKVLQNAQAKHSRIKIYDDRFSYLEYNDKNIIIHTINYINWVDLTSGYLC